MSVLSPHFATGPQLPRRQLLLGAAALGLGSAALSSCSGSGGDPKQLTLWHGWTGGVNTESLNKVLEQFNQDNEQGVRVKPTALPWDDLFSKLVVSAASGESPNCVMYHTSEVAEYASREVTVELDSLLKEVGLDLSSIPENILESARFEGELHAVPLDVHPLGLYVNTELVEAAGLNPESLPADQESFLGWAKELTGTIKGKDVYGVSVPYRGANPSWLWWTFLHQNGGRFLADPEHCAVDSEESQEALQFVVDLVHKYKVVQPNVSEDADPVARKTAAMWFSGPWEVTQRLGQKLEIATAAVPQIGDQPATWANCHAQAITSQKSDEADTNGLRFISWFFENYALPAREVGVVPLSQSVREGEDFTGDERYQYYKPFVQQMESAVAAPTIPQYNRIFSFGKPTPLSTNLEAAISRSKPVDQALTDMKTGIDEELSRDL